MLLSGCLGDAGTAENSALESFSVAEYDDTTGALAGLVLDDALQPVPEVLLVLDGRLETISGPDGTFGFSRVPPGEYELVAAKEGFEQSQRLVLVEVQQITQVRVTLIPVGAALAYHETKIGTSFVGCGVGVRNQQLNSPPAGVGGVALCSTLPVAVQNATGLRDRFRLDWRLGSLENMTGIFAETKWVSTQVLGKGMRVRWYFGASGGQLGPFLGERDAASPLSLRFPIALLRENATLTPTATASGAAGTVSATQCLTQSCPFVSFHYAGRNNLGPQYPADMGLALQQRLDDYLTAFYFEAFPEQFSALPDR